VVQLDLTCVNGPFFSDFKNVSATSWSLLSPEGFKYPSAAVMYSKNWKCAEKVSHLDLNLKKKT